MTPEEIKKLSDEQLNRAIHEAMGNCTSCHKKAGWLDNPDYCNDLNTAWKIIDYLKTYSRFDNSTGFEDFRFTFRNGIPKFAMFESNRHGAISDNPNPARAICEAALMAMKGGVDGNK